MGKLKNPQKRSHRIAPAYSNLGGAVLKQVQHDTTGSLQILHPTQLY
jgi:hypothetical protein